MFLIFALVVAIIGIVPLLVRTKWFCAAVMGGICTLIMWLILYLFPVPLTGPLYGWFGLSVFAIWVAAAAVDMLVDHEGKKHISFITVGFPLTLAVIYVVIEISSWGIFNAQTYASAIGDLPTQQWTQDVQPKDPRHMRMASKENALQLAKNSLGQMGAVGSQFQIAEKYATLQMVSNELQWVIPLDFAGYAVWSSTGKVPAYILVDAEDPSAVPRLVELPNDKKMVYTPGAFFSSNLERHLYTNGYATKNLIDWTFEVDDQLQEWWVVTVCSPYYLGQGNRVEGVAVVNPTSGGITYYAVGSVPEWVDRVYPDEVVKEYLDWWGQYSGGGWNAFWTSLNLIEPETPKMIYGTGDQPEWVTALTSKSISDHSLVGMVYTNSRTGKSTLYNIRGGGTDKRILEVVNSNGDVQYKGQHGTDPQIYNVYGTVAAVVPLLNKENVFSGVAVVEVENPQTAAVGKDQFEAIRQYQTMLAASGSRTSINQSSELQKASGVVVERIGQDFSQSGTVYYIYVKGFPHVFVGEIRLSSKLPLTQKGDMVVIQYYDSKEDRVPIYTFDNLSLVLSSTDDQKVVRQSEEQKSDSQRTEKDAEVVKERLKKLTPQQLKELKDKLPK